VESYQLFIKVHSSRLILKGNRPEGLTRREEEEEEVEEEEKGEEEEEEEEEG
jgi:hypothetical protein